MRQRPVVVGTALLWIVASAALLAQGTTSTGVSWLLPTYRTMVIAIGVGAHFDANIEGVVDARANAEKIFGRLTQRPTGLGTEASVLLVDSAATRAAILKTLSQAMSLSDGNYGAMFTRRQVLVYWSGRCFRGDNETYLLPYDASLSAITTSGISLSDLVAIIGRVKNRSYAILILGNCDSDGTFTQKLETDYPRVGVLSEGRRLTLSSSAIASASVLTTALDDTLSSPTGDIDRDGFVSLEEAFVGMYATMVRRSSGLQYPVLTGGNPRSLRVARAAHSDRRLRFDQPLPPELRSAKSIIVNGESVAIDTQQSTASELVFLGSAEGPVARGLVVLEAARNKYRYWREEQNLQAFTDPYKNSYAVLIAIDDYQRKRDPERRGPTGYEARGLMVQRARELGTTLTKLGFPSDRIITLFDSEATTRTIDETLQTFWPGGRRANADRVLVYFGGHGDTFNGNGVLITYNFQPAQPTVSGYLMRDLTTRHAENIAAHHVLFAIDACGSGLAVYKKLGNTTTVPPAFAELSVIRNDTASKARNVLVAGTEDQPAVWDQGGIFTRSLIRGLQGAADLSQDGLIQFLELSTFVGNEVARQAAARGVRQQVQPYTLDALGTGNFMFLRDYESSQRPVSR